METNKYQRDTVKGMKLKNLLVQEEYIQSQLNTAHQRNDMKYIDTSVNGETLTEEWRQSHI